MKKGAFAQGVVWFGAAVSVAEIEAGLQSGGNWIALILGHLLGGFLLFAAGLLGARSGENAMQTTRMTFGRNGMYPFALLNLLQLVGWTSVMIAQGGVAAAQLTGLDSWICVIVLAALVAVWVLVGLDNFLYLNTVAVIALAILAAVLTWGLLALPPAARPSDLDFRTAFELSVAMPLSWLPLVSDYTRHSARPIAGSVASSVSYTIASIWMFGVGMLLGRSGAMTLTAGILESGIGMTGLAVITVSTVTTTFLDAYSSGESARAVLPSVRPKSVGVIVCAIGAGLAISGIVERYIDFLCLIASVFAPMAAVLLVDRYLVCRHCHAWNLLSWFAGVAAYQLTSGFGLGPSLTAIVVSGVLTVFSTVLPKRTSR